MKILLWDIETYPLVVTTWNLRPDSIHYQNIIEEWGIISAAWKWLGEKEVHHVAVDPADPKNDRRVVKALHDAISEADVIVHHYGDRFDLPKFKARSVYWGLPPVPPIKTVDTWKLAARIFGFTSNRLDYLGRFLGLGEKIKTSNDLWTRVMAGDAAALVRMVRYNKQDVRLLEKIYLKLRPYTTTHPNEGLTSFRSCCPVCGSKDFTKRGFKYNRTTTRQQYQCSKPTCRAWFVGEQIARVRTS